MDHPVKEIRSVVKTLTQGTPEEQQRTVKNFFIPEATFTHPLCRVPSLTPRRVPYVDTTIDSRWFILMIYRWYRILSPNIELEIESTVQDQKTNTLYLNIHQVFTYFFLPFYHADVKLVTVLRLEQRPMSGDGSAVALVNGNYDTATTTNGVTTNGSRRGQGQQRFYIASQEDYYQTNEILKFVAPFFGAPLLIAWQIFATLLSVLGAFIFAPLSWYPVGAIVKAEKKEA